MRNATGPAGPTLAVLLLSVGCRGPSTQKLQAEMHDLREDLESERKHGRNLETELHEVKAARLRLAAAFSETNARNSSSLEEAQAETDRLKVENATLAADRAELQKALKAAEGKIAELQRSVPTEKKRRSVAEENLKRYQGKHGEGAGAEQRGDFRPALPAIVPGETPKETFDAVMTAIGSGRTEILLELLAPSVKQEGMLVVMLSAAQTIDEARQVQAGLKGEYGKAVAEQKFRMIGMTFDEVASATKERVAGAFFRPMVPPEGSTFVRADVDDAAATAVVHCTTASGDAKTLKLVSEGGCWYVGKQ